MQLEFLTQRGVAYEGRAQSVSLATAGGQVSILPHHEPLTAVVAAGPVSVRLEDGSVRHYAAYGGILEVTARAVRLLTDEAEPAEAMVEVEIAAALAYAESLARQARDQHEIRQARDLAGRHAVRLQVAGMHRRRREGGSGQSQLRP